MYLTLFGLLGLVSLSHAAPAVQTPSLSSTLKELGVNPSTFLLYDQKNFHTKPWLTCLVLDKIFGAKLTNSADGGIYNAQTEITWAQTCWSKPACIITPSNSNDVRKAVLVLNAFQTKFSVRSGGHMANPGFANAYSDGVLISLSSLTNLAISADRSRAIIGVGNRWGSVYNYLQPYNVTVTGGRIGTVGVGGLVLGGGLNYFSAQYGLAADTVERFEVVLSNGSIINATRAQSSDLFQALKGGSANFGIVTEYEMRTRYSGPLYYEALLFPPDQYAALFKALIEYQNNGLKDTKSSLVTSFRKEGNLLIFLHLDPVLRPAAFDPFYALPSFPFFPPGVATITDLVQAVAIGFSAEPERDLTRVSTFEVDEETFLYSYELFQQVSATLPLNATIEYVPQSIGLDIVNLGVKNGGNMLGLAPKSQIWLDIVAKWKNPADDAFIVNATKFILDKTDEFAKKRGKHLPFLFMNDAYADQKVLRSYGAKNFDKIVKASKKYDPSQFFQKLQGNGYLWTKQ